MGRQVCLYYMHMCVTYIASRITFIEAFINFLLLLVGGTFEKVLKHFARLGEFVQIVECGGRCGRRFVQYRLLLVGHVVVMVAGQFL